MPDRHTGAPPKEALPRHIGIIMDGNGRWAKKRGLPREAGHKAGADNFTKILRYCKSIGIPYLTVYAFSTENWKRPAGEVGALMRLLGDYLRDSRRYMEENARLVVLGDRQGLSQELQKQIAEAEHSSAGNTAITLGLAINYGGRGELVRAIKSIAESAAHGELSPDDITEDTVAGRLYTAGMPDPDLIIRPSGELRLSNFLMWQSAYSELVFMDVLWPDFSPAHLDAALWEYAGRCRRFGGI